MGVLDAQELKKAAYARARVLSEANLKARLIRETRSEDAIYTTFKLMKPKLGDPYLEVQAQMEQMTRLADFDKHIVLFNGLRHVRILFCNAKETEYWIVERDLYRGTLRKSMIYSSREQAMLHHDVNTVRYLIKV